MAAAEKSVKKRCTSGVFVCVLLMNVSHLDADLIGLRWGDFNLLDHQRFVGLPCHGCLALDDLVGSNTTTTLLTMMDEK